MITQGLVRLVASVFKPGGKRPSLVWRVVWLWFCLHVIKKSGGPETLKDVVPYVLAGLGDNPTAPLLPAATEPDRDQDLTIEKQTPGANQTPTTSAGSVQTNAADTTSQPNADLRRE